MHIAQLNIATPKFDLDAPEIADFMNNLEPINAVAESSKGFIWRLKDEGGDATNIQIFNDPDMLVNMSVWENVDCLKAFMFKTHHIEFLKRKKEWFHTPKEASYVIWHVPVGHIPTVKEAEEKLVHLRAYGETLTAFSFKSNF